jgi:flagella basal body P-ring formation protein FlgA
MKLSSVRYLVASAVLASLFGSSAGLCQSPQDAAAAAREQVRVQKELAGQQRVLQARLKEKVAGAYATTDIKTGTVITQSMVRDYGLKRQDQAPDAMGRSKDVIGRTTNKDIKKGSYINRHDLVPLPGQLP